MHGHRNPKLAKKILNYSLTCPIWQFRDVCVLHLQRRWLLVDSPFHLAVEHFFDTQNLRSCQLHFAQSRFHLSEAEIDHCDSRSVWLHKIRYFSAFELLRYNTRQSDYNMDWPTKKSWFDFRQRRNMFIRNCRRYAAVWMRSVILWDLTQRRMVGSYWRFGPTCGTHLQGSFGILRSVEL